MKKLFNETLIYGIGAILPRVITFILNPFYILFIDRSEFAQFTNLYAWASFINILLTFGFETSFFRFSAEKENNEKVFNTSFWFLFGTSTLFLISTLLFSVPIAEKIGYAEHPEYIRWFAWIAFFDTIIVIPLAWLRFNNKPIKYSAIRIGQILVQTALVFTLFLFISEDLLKSIGMEEKVSYTFISNIIGSFAGIIFLLPVLRKLRLVFSTDLFKKMIKYSYPVMLAGFAFMVNENFDKLIQYNIISEADAGAYGGCYKLAVLMTLFVTAYRMGIEPFLFKQMGNDHAKESYANITQYFTLFASVAALAIIVNINWLKEIFIPNSGYWVAIDIVPVIVIANLCFGIYYNLSTWYKVTDRTQIGTLISWSGAIVTIVLNILLLKEYGFMVSAWTTLAAYFLMMIMSYVLGQKYYPIPYKTGKILLVLAILVLMSYLSYIVFNGNFWIGNLILFIFIGIICFIERQTISALIKRKN